MICGGDIGVRSNFFMTLNGSGSAHDASVDFGASDESSTFSPDLVGLLKGMLLLGGTGIVSIFGNFGNNSDDISLEDLSAKIREGNKAYLESNPNYTTQPPEVQREMRERFMQELIKRPIRDRSNPYAGEERMIALRNVLEGMNIEPRAGTPEAVVVVAPPRPVNVDPYEPITPRVGEVEVEKIYTNVEEFLRDQKPGVFELPPETRSVIIEKMWKALRGGRISCSSEGQFYYDVIYYEGAYERAVSDPAVRSAMDRVAPARPAVPAIPIFEVGGRKGTSGGMPDTSLASAIDFVIPRPPAVPDFGEPARDMRPEVLPISGSSEVLAAIVDLERDAQGPAAKKLGHAWVMHDTLAIVDRLMSVKEFAELTPQKRIKVARQIVDTVAPSTYLNGLGMAPTIDANMASEVLRENGVEVSPERIGDIKLSRNAAARDRAFSLNAQRIAVGKYLSETGHFDTLSENVRERAIAGVAEYLVERWNSMGESLRQNIMLTRVAGFRARYLKGVNQIWVLAQLEGLKRGDMSDAATSEAMERISRIHRASKIVLKAMNGNDSPFRNRSPESKAKTAEAVARTIVTHPEFAEKYYNDGKISMEAVRAAEVAVLEASEVAYMSLEGPTAGRSFRMSPKDRAFMERVKASRAKARSASRRGRK